MSWLFTWKILTAAVRHCAIVGVRQTTQLESTETARQLMLSGPAKLVNFWLLAYRESEIARVTTSQRAQLVEQDRWRLFFHACDQLGPVCSTDISGQHRYNLQAQMHEAGRQGGWAVASSIWPEIYFRQLSSEFNSKFNITDSLVQGLGRVYQHR